MNERACTGMPAEIFLDGRVRLLSGDCAAMLPLLPDNSIDACVCDPPYHLTSIVQRFGADNAAPAKAGKKANATGAYARASAGFMGKKWDGGDIAFRPELWREVLRVLKPGGHVLACGGTRTIHNMAKAIELAGFEIRDLLAELLACDTSVATFLRSLSEEQVRAFVRCIDESMFGGMLYWIYGSGFPKSHNISVAIDDHLFGKWLDAEPARRHEYTAAMRAAKALEDAKERKAALDKVESAWRKLGGFERAVVGEKQAGMGTGKTFGMLQAEGDNAGATKLVEVTAPATAEAREWAGWGTALKPACEPIVLGRKPLDASTIAANVLAFRTGALNIDGCRVEQDGLRATSTGGMAGKANPIFGSFSGTPVDAVAAVLTATGRWPANILTDGSAEVAALFPETQSSGEGGLVEYDQPDIRGDNFNRADARQARLGLSFDDAGSVARFFYNAKADSDDRLGSKHPTVKPVDLMQYLVRLVTPPGGIVLDPFAGTGTTGEAAWREGCNAVLIEREAEYQDDIRRRMRLCLAGPDERAREAIKAKLKGQPLDAGPLFGGSETVDASGRAIYGVYADEKKPRAGKGRRIGPVGLAGSVRDEAA